jgi:GNAT superfamily N-acetyltransferase
MTGLHVGLLGPGDWEALRAVRLAALADSPDAFASTLAREQAFDEAEWRRRASRGSLIAWHGKDPVGLAGMIDRAGLAPAESSGTWELVAMWVRPEARGTGAADALVSAVIRAVKAADAGQLVLWVAEGNARARAFYGRRGFQPTGTRQVFQRHDGSSLNEEELILNLA